MDEYDINSKYEEHGEGDDKSGSRTYPSRTYIGRQRVIGKDMPWLMQSRRILFWVVPQYMFRWGLSKPYIDILYADDVITQYDYKSKHKKTAQERLEEKNNDPRGQDKAWQTMHKWYATHPDKAAAQPEEARKYGVEPPTKVDIATL